MKRLATLTACLFAAALGTAHAAPITYTIDGKHTFAYFSYNHLGLTYQTHGFNKVSGKIVLDQENTSGEADISIDAKSLDTGYADFNSHLQGPDFFDTAKYPTITYKAKKFNFAGAALQTIEGDMTIKGITKPVAFVVSNFVCKQHPMLKKDACGANALAQISRTAFGMSKYVPGVADDVTLNIMVEAIKQ